MGGMYQLGQVLHPALWPFTSWVDVINKPKPARLDELPNAIYLLDTFDHLMPLACGQMLACQTRRLVHPALPCPACPQLPAAIDRTSTYATWLICMCACMCLCIGEGGTITEGEFGVMADTWTHTWQEGCREQQGGKAGRIQSKRGFAARSLYVWLLNWPPQQDFRRALWPCSPFPNSALTAMSFAA